jgi:nucleoid DNA-binding protein
MRRGAVARNLKKTWGFCHLSLTIRAAQSNLIHELLLIRNVLPNLLTPYEGASMAANKAKAATKTEVYAALAEKSGLTKKQIGTVLDALTELIRSQIGKKGPGIFQLPGLLKIKKRVRPPQPEREGRNPKTGETMTIKAKPAKTVVRVLPLKNLKEMVA